MTLKEQAISGVKWTTVSTISLAAGQLLKISVLTRFLDKSDFGLIAIVVFVLGFTNLFVDMGLSVAILHKQNISKNQYASLYWFNFMISGLIFFIVWLIAPVIAGFYKQPELNNLIPLMASTILFAAFGRQFNVIEQKKLNFKFISLVNIFHYCI
jgi:O-antigen/teichoic acid export membrane protein